ncbi:MAG: tetratricopeptide repeat protein [Planctomycetota bacterium]|jgi:tetratricopeptide (TPR) repeat protein
MEFATKFLNLRSKSSKDTGEQEQTTQAMTIMEETLTANTSLGPYQKSYTRCFNRGTTYLQKGRYDRAIAELTKCLERSPGFAPAYVNRGLAYCNKGEYDMAISDFTEAIETHLNPSQAKACNNRAFAYYQKGEYSKAWKDVHRLDGLGHFKVNPELLKNLCERSR